MEVEKRVESRVLLLSLARLRTLLTPDFLRLSSSRDFWLKLGHVTLVTEHKAQSAHIDKT